MPAAALLAALLAAATAKFPFGPPAVRSPDGTMQIVNWDPVGNEAPHKLFLRRRGGPKQLLYQYGRDVLVVWSPDSRRIAITDYGGSDYAVCVVIDVRSLSSVDITETAKSASKRVASVMRNDHAYFECLGWKSDRVLRVRARGYGDIDPNGATVVTTVTLPR